MPAAATGQEVGREERRLILQVIQPGLLGLMDGSVSTLAPLFAAAAMTGRPRDAFGSCCPAWTSPCRSRMSWSCSSFFRSHLSASAICRPRLVEPSSR